MRSGRLFLSLLLLLALVLGGSRFGVGAAEAVQVDQPGDTTTVFVDGANALDAAASSVCNECDDADKARLACPPPCMGVPAIVLEGILATIEVAVEVAAPAADESISGRTTAPDPYPPK